MSDSRNRAVSDFEINHFLQQLKDAPDDVKRELWNQMRAFALPEADDATKVRVLSNGSPVTDTASGSRVGFKPDSYFDILNFIGTVMVNSRTNGRQADIYLGGGSDCMFDHLVSSCWATMVAAGKGVEGQTFVSLTGCTFRVWSTVQGAHDVAINESSNQTIFICPGGDVGPLSVTTDNGQTLYGIIYIGANPRDSVIPGTSSVWAVDISGGSRPLIFKDLAIPTIDGASHRSLRKTAGTQAITMDNCRVGSRLGFGPVISGGSGLVRFFDCEFPTNQAGQYALDMSGYASYTKIVDCIFDDRLRVGEDCYIEGGFCNYGAGAVGVVKSTVAGTSALYVDGLTFRMSGTPWTSYFDFNDANFTFHVRNCVANTGATQAILIGSLHNVDGGWMTVTGNSWGCDLGILHTASSTIMLINYSNNTHRGTTGAGAATVSPVIANGNFGNSVFDGNGPARSRVTFVAGSGINTVEGVQASSGTPSHQAQERTLYWDTSANIMYVNTDGSTTWAAILTSGSVSTFFSIVEYVFMPDAAPGVMITAGDAQGVILHSGPGAETATRIYADYETAPGAATQSATAQYGDTDDLDTVASWTTIAAVTNGNGVKSNLNDTMTNAAIPANRLLRCNFAQSEGADGSVTLRAKRPLTV